MDPEKITVASFGAALLAIVIWILKFVFTRLEKTITESSDKVELAVRANTHAIANLRLVLYVLAKGMGLEVDIPPPDDKTGKMY